VAAEASPLPPRLGAGVADDGACKLYVTNLAPTTTLESLQAHFASHGEVLAADWPEGTTTGARTSYAFVVMSRRSEAVRAVEAVPVGPTLDGQALVVQVDDARVRTRFGKELSLGSGGSWDEAGAAALAAADAADAARAAAPAAAAGSGSGFDGVEFAGAVPAGLDDASDDEDEAAAGSSARTSSEPLPQAQSRPAPPDASALTFVWGSESDEALTAPQLVDRLRAAAGGDGAESDLDVLVTVGGDAPPYAVEGSAPVATRRAAAAETAPGTDCPVCQDGIYPDDELRVFPCYDDGALSVHKSCYDNWLLYSSSAMTS